MDDSREAIAERGKLEEELAELQKDLADTQADHWLEKTEEKLDKELDAWEKAKDQEIADLESFLDDEVQIRQEALLRVENMNEELYQKLLEYAVNYCDMSAYEFEQMWQRAMAAAEKYGSYVNAMDAVPGGDKETTVSNIIDQMNEHRNAYAAATTDAEREYHANKNLELGAQLQAATGQKVYRDNDGYWWIGDEYLFDYGKGSGNTNSSVAKRNREKVSDIVAEMKEAGSKWRADDPNRDKIHEEVAGMTKDLSQYGVKVNYDSASGKWIIVRDDNDLSNVGKWLYECYHTGGIVGGAQYANLKEREVFANIEKGEWVLTKQHQSNLMKFMDSVKPLFNLSAAFSSLAGKLVGNSGGNQMSFEINAPLSVHSDISDSRFRRMAEDNARYIANAVAKELGV